MFIKFFNFNQTLVHSSKYGNSSTNFLIGGIVAAIFIYFTTKDRFVAPKRMQNIYDSPAEEAAIRQSLIGNGVLDV